MVRRSFMQGVAMLAAGFFVPLPRALEVARPVALALGAELSANARYAMWLASNSLYGKYATSTIAREAGRIEKMMGEVRR